MSVVAETLLRSIACSSSSDPDAKRYYKNWVIVFALANLVGIGFYISVTSLHQFVTSSSKPVDPEVCISCSC